MPCIVQATLASGGRFGVRWASSFSSHVSDSHFAIPNAACAPGPQIKHRGRSPQLRSTSALPFTPPYVTAGRLAAPAWRLISPTSHCTAPRAFDQAPPTTGASGACQRWRLPLCRRALPYRLHGVRSFGREFAFLPFWALILTIALGGAWQRLRELTSKPRLPPLMVRTNFDTGTSGMVSKDCGCRR